MWNNFFEKAVCKALLAKKAAMFCCNNIAPGSGISEAVYNYPNKAVIFRSLHSCAELKKLGELSRVAGFNPVFQIKSAEYLLHPLQNSSGDFCTVYLNSCNHEKIASLLHKKAIEPLDSLAGITGWNGKYIDVPGFPSPAAAMLGTGLLGAGAGYAASIPVAKLVPKKWNKKKLKRLMTIIPAVLGAGAALPWVVGAVASGESPLNNDVIRDPALKKSGSFIDVSSFNNTLYNNPILAQQLSERDKALTSGLLSSTSLVNQSPIVTPSDIGRMTAAMGSGYLSGALVGKALGMLAGAPEDTQEKLMQMGMYAGLIKSVIPSAFRR